MADVNTEQLKKRFTELGDRAYARGRYEYSDFLALAEQDILLSMRPAPSAFCGLYGGFDTAERRVAVFGGEAVCGYVETPPVVCLRISPASLKFAENLTHRDYLGSLMSLGIKREVLGDIVINGHDAYLFCLESIAAFITENLTQVRRTTVSTEICDAPEIVTRDPDPTEFNVASERPDAVVAAVYNISRSKAAQLFDDALVFVNGRTAKTTHVLEEGDIVSVRHMGRFVYCGILKETRKGRLRVSVKVY